MRKIISLICILLPILASADELTIRDNAPDRYTVVKGDTLWDISNKFFKDPWKWPEIWGMNKDDIKDPHWIYPGDIIVLDRNAKTIHIGELPPPQAEAAATSAPAAAETADKPVIANIPLNGDTNTVKLQPKIRVLERNDAVSSIPAKIIAPFLNRPLVVEEDYLKHAPVIVGSVENRNLLSFGDTAFVDGLPTDQGNNWQIFRPGQELVDPETGDTLGYEAVYLGDANVIKFDKVSTVTISKSVLEIYKGDYLVQSSSALPPNIVPRSPPVQIKAKVMSVFGGMDQAGQYSVITINKGHSDGLDVGHVLALYKESEISKFQGDEYKLPALRYGLVFIFRTFDKISYALVMEVKLPVKVNDDVETP